MRDLEKILYFEAHVVLDPKDTELEKGDRLWIQTPGGGGWGNPKERTRQKVANDVTDGLVNEKRARDVYG